MKIAVQVFGHMRTFQKCAPILKKKVLDKYNCDVFIHTWSKPYHDGEDVNYADFYSDIVRLYDPKVIKIEQQGFYNEMGSYAVDNNTSFNGSNPLISGLKYMCYSMVSVNLLRMSFQEKNCIDYDYILFIRPDIYINEDFDIEVFNNEFNFNQNTLISFINYPVLTVASKRVGVIYLANDVFMLTLPSVANLIFKSLSDFDKYYVDFPKKFPINNFHPEASFSEMIVSKGIIHKAYIFSYNISRKSRKDDIIVSLDASNKYIPLNNFIGNNTKLKKYKLRLFYLFILLFFSLVINFCYLANFF